MSVGRKRKSFLHKHSLSIVSCIILTTWILLYTYSSPSTHLGSFFGNAIADWTGVVVTVLATKLMYERGSAESRRPPKDSGNVILAHLRDHSLTIFLLATGIAWVALYASVNSESKWGQVVGNIVSEWTQIFGLVLMTKRLMEPHSKESSH
jgi:small neutral amino acid transporter SnatA (MarC family)